MKKPVVALLCQPRSGSSMVMAMLQAGGLDIECFIVKEDPIRLKILNNPHGIFEGCKNNGTQKVFDVNFALQLPPEFKLIYLKRNIDDIIISWKNISKRYKELLGIDYNVDEHIKEIYLFESDWKETLPKLEDVLYLEYDDIMNNPKDACRAIAEHINTDTFKFNEILAESVVDKNIDNNDK